jgi:hypothetical protein
MYHMSRPGILAANELPLRPSWHLNDGEAAIRQSG